MSIFVANIVKSICLSENNMSTISTMIFKVACSTIWTISLNTGSCQKRWPCEPCLTVVEIACIEPFEIVFITRFRIISKTVEFNFAHTGIRVRGTVVHDWMIEIGPWNPGLMMSKWPVWQFWPLLYRMRLHLWTDGHQMAIDNTHQFFQIHHKDSKLWKSARSVNHLGQYKRELSGFHQRHQTQPISHFPEHW